MQPDTPSTGARPVFPVSRAVPLKTPRWVAVGVAMAGIGFLLERLPGLLILPLLRSVTLVQYVQVELALSSTGVLLLGVGLWLVLRYLRERLPTGRPWISIGILAVLAGALCTATVGFVDLALAPSIYGFGAPGSLPAYLSEILNDVVWVTQFAIGVGVLLAIFGTARGLAIPAPPAVPPTFP